MSDIRATWPKIQRGFAALSPEKRTEISRLGGAGVSPQKRSFTRNPELAVAADRKGGLARVANAAGKAPIIRGNAMYRFWSAEDDAILVTVYPVEGAAAAAEALNRSLPSIYSRIKRHKLSAPVRKYPPVVFDIVLDLVREECIASCCIGLTAADIFTPNRHRAVAWVRARVFRRLVDAGHSRNAIGIAFGVEHSVVNYAINRKFDQKPPPGGSFDKKYRRDLLKKYAAEHTQVYP